MINWIRNHPNLSWLAGIILVPLLVFALGYSIAFLAAKINESWMQLVIDATHILIFLSPVIITVWSLSTRKKDREQEDRE